MRILQINTVVNSGSTGRIAEDIGNVLMMNGHESYIAYGRGNRPSKSKLITIGKKKDIYLHVLKTLIFDRHGFGSTTATRKLIENIEQIKPDVIGLHNLHGYYLNIEVLFSYLAKKRIPVLWTLFDCWGFTGHCSYFDDIQCRKWENGCYECPKKKSYPSSYIFDNSQRNFFNKEKLFNSLEKMELVVHSKWLENIVNKSFLNKWPIHTFPTGINIDVFRHTDGVMKQKLSLKNKKVILGCASIWSKRKGLKDFISLNSFMAEDFVLVLVGLSEEQRRSLPANMIGIEKTESIKELAELYSAADVFVNPTHQDNFPTTNIESLACGTPVITYNTGGSPEAIDKQTGVVVNQGDIKGLATAIRQVVEKGKAYYAPYCRKRAEKYYNKDLRYLNYQSLYHNLAVSKWKG